MSRPPPASRPCLWRARHPRGCSRPAPCVVRTTPRRCPLRDRSASSTRLVSTRATQRTTHQHHAHAPRIQLILTSPTHHAPRGAWCVVGPKTQTAYHALRATPRHTLKRHAPRTRPHLGPGAGHGALLPRGRGQARPRRHAGRPRLRRGRILPSALRRRH